jgi:glycosyltransferase involved in cell wall biosynthesis
VLPHEARWWDVWIAKMGLRWGTWFAVQSPDEQAHLHALLPQARMRVNPLPLFDMFAGERVPQEEARQRLGLPLNAPVLLFFGFVREYKGLVDALEALPEVRACLGKVILLVAGEFWEDKRPYLELVERLGIGDAVRIHDRYIPNEEVVDCFSAADLLVAPYRRVTGSAVVQMAKSFGLPVVATCVGDLADSEASGLLVRPGDSRALAAAICQQLSGGVQGALTDSLHVERAKLDEVVQLIEQTGAESADR